MTGYYRNGGYRNGGGRNNHQHVYTDGASSGNGRSGARAGYGVYYGDNDSRNTSMPLSGSRQTNQRAELTAVNHALRNSDPNQPLTIHSDSSYGIKSMTEWGNRWDQNGYRTSSGGAVANQDLIREGRDLIASRNVPVSFSHVPSHSGNHGNDMADRFATNGAKMH
ncbi:hypothetical protein H4R20_005028 [Coemansia guatemalensis]|uniref:ribonuclease H n=1 Tax=Coemansia guatemalensis TaxID=2761395 RepID=A0A9W8HYQ5_9FUNG|nr:hypothetical protein H4R20_005028 [Coemansia guatemalensis]